MEKNEISWDESPPFPRCPFSHFSTASPPFLHVPLMNFASRTKGLEKWNIVGEPTLGFDRLPRCLVGSSREGGVSSPALPVDPPPHSPLKWDGTQRVNSNAHALCPSHRICSHGSRCAPTSPSAVRHLGDQSIIPLYTYCESSIPISCSQSPLCRSACSTPTTTIPTVPAAPWKRGSFAHMPS